MASPAQFAANAANARLSTGPRTEEGKSKSARNALKHGLTARDLVVADDEREEFAAFQTALLADLGPQGALETVVFHQLLCAAWKQQRFSRLEASLAVNRNDPVLDLDPATVATIDRLVRYAARAERSFHRSLAELRTLQTNRAMRATELDPDEEDSVPLAADIDDLAKRSQADALEAMKMELARIDLEAATFLQAHRAARMQNKPNSAPPIPPVPPQFAPTPGR